MIGPPPEPTPGPKPGPKILPTKSPMICKTDEDCKAGETCATFMGMPIGCIPADGPIPIPPKKGKLSSKVAHS